jgi:hypothetical protein
MLSHYDMIVVTAAKSRLSRSKEIYYLFSIITSY